MMLSLSINNIIHKGDSTMGYVYKYTHNESGKWYIGSHNGSKPNYTGSGLIWRKALKKYGLDSFNKEILYEGDLYQQEEERILKELDAQADVLSYNMKNEALGGSYPGELNGMYGKVHDAETKYNMGSGYRGKKRPDHAEKMSGENNPMYGKSDHVQAAVALAKSNTGKTYNEIFGEERSAEIRERLSIAQTGVLKPGTSRSQSGGGNSSAKPVTINGVLYGCIKEAMVATGLSRYKILKS